MAVGNGWAQMQRSAEKIQMKLLVVSDAISPLVYGKLDSASFSGVELVISCGDLPLNYLEYIISMLNVSCYFVPGNHDETYLENPPPGWNSLDGRIVNHNGIRLMGLGGSISYKPDSGPYYYSEKQMQLRLIRLLPQLWLHKKIDILVTHAPPFQLGDLVGPHQGFKVFRKILKQYQPRYHLHGHVHLNYSQNPRILHCGRTSIINAFEHHLFDCVIDR